MVEVRRLNGAAMRTHLDALAAVLFDCVEGGASVSFMAPFSLHEARSFFEGVLPQVESGARLLLAAFDGDRLIGTVQLILSVPPNQPHRADVAKLLVHRSARGQHVGVALMQRLEQEALAEGKTLLVLDTVTGSVAERLYTRMGWIRAGTIQNYAMFPDGRPCDTTIFWKALTAAS